MRLGLVFSLENGKQENELEACMAVFHSRRGGSRIPVILDLYAEVCFGHFT
jgi:hypothetical protein